METPLNAILAISSSSPSNPESLQPESRLSSLIYDMSQQFQVAMENMLKMTNEIDQNSAGVCEAIEKCKEAALERKRTLEEEKQRFQKTAYLVLDMLNNPSI
ncbi:hypothetical protein RJ641_022290 [Dillenia turbinata]|uniref:Uncharacterized protein n=1 Tax=Dillenia turbinata TaxID=194707 RepID=A0AAN8YRJ7_9MAGN